MPKSTMLLYHIGLVIGEVQTDSHYHLLSWSSHKSQHPVKSTPEAEIFAASEAIDKLLVLQEASRLSVVLRKDPLSYWTPKLISKRWKLSTIW